MSTQNVSDYDQDLIFFYPSLFCQKSAEKKYYFEGLSAGWWERWGGGCSNCMQCCRCTDSQPGIYMALAAVHSLTDCCMQHWLTAASVCPVCVQHWLGPHCSRPESAALSAVTSSSQDSVVLWSTCSTAVCTSLSEKSDSLVILIMSSSPSSTPGPPPPLPDPLLAAANMQRLLQVYRTLAPYTIGGPSSTSLETPGQQLQAPRAPTDQRFFRKFAPFPWFPRPPMMPPSHSFLASKSEDPGAVMISGGRKRHCSSGDSSQHQQPIFSPRDRDSSRLEQWCQIIALKLCENSMKYWFCINHSLQRLENLLCVDIRIHDFFFKNV